MHQLFIFCNNSINSLISELTVINIHVHYWSSFFLLVMFYWHTNKKLIDRGASNEHSCYRLISTFSAASEYKKETDDALTERKKDDKCIHSWGQNIFSILSKQFLSKLNFNYNYYDTYFSKVFSNTSPWTKCKWKVSVRWYSKMNKY